MIKRIIIVVLIFYLTTPNVYAATFFFNPPAKNVTVNEEFNISLELDAEDEFINAVEGQIHLPLNLIEIVAIDYHQSIIAVWLYPPQINRGQIVFAGIIPGGFDGVRKPLDSKKYPGELFNITLRTKGAGSEAIIMSDILALKNDGYGSSATVSLIPFALNVVSTAPPPLINNWWPILIIILIVILLISIKKFKQ